VPANEDPSGGGDTDAPASRGRPRDQRRRSAVVAATRDLLIERGYDDITLAAVARRAGVSRPFVYENWGTKFALVEDAIFTAGDVPPSLDEDKTFAEAFRELIAAMVGVQGDPAYLAGLPGVTTELYKRPDLVEQIETKYIAPVRAQYVALVERGKADGAVHPDVDGSALLDTVRGAVMLHTLVNPTLSETKLIEHLHITILRGIGTRG
jgi:AcrR family transcriptional regulator